MYPWRYPAAVNALARHAKPMYQDWNQKLQPVTGIDFQIHETGMLIFDESDFEIGLSYAATHQEPQQQAKLLDQAKLQQINPKVDNSKFKQAIYFSELANIRNPRLLQSIIRYLKQHPRVTWQEDCKITRLNLQQGCVKVSQMNMAGFFRQISMCSQPEHGHNTGHSNLVWKFRYNRCKARCCCLKRQKTGCRPCA